MLNKSEKIKITVFVPETHANVVREAIGNAGGGEIGDYDFCSFSTKGIGRFRPKDGANPTIGETGKVESVQEERIEFLCNRDTMNDIISTIKKVHPYEEVPLDIYSLEDF